MKTWLTRFRFSNALGDANSSRKQMLPRGRQSEEARQFETTMRDLDRQLKAAQPARSMPSDLHDNIMRVVRGASREQEWQSALTIWRRLPAPALVLLVVGGVWWTLSRPQPQSEPLRSAGAVLEQGRELTLQAPAAVLAPLSKEMESLNRDFRNAVEFLVASVP
jgi:hypothetical protein